MSARIRVLIVDDSAFVRKVLREVLTRRPSIEVVGIARDGLEALEKIAELTPDVITLDLTMPNLDGIGVLNALQGRSAPATVLVSTSAADSELAIRAFELGAVELVEKPTSLATDRLYELAGELSAKVEAAAFARLQQLGHAPRQAPLERTQVSRALATSYEVVVVGTSTGGPQALARLLSALPGDFPLPIAIALHIPAGYTKALARRIDELSQLEVVEAEPGIALTPGRAVVARGGSHLKLKKLDGALIGAITGVPAYRPHLPSVDVLFESAVSSCGAGVVGVVLTGMGNDGTQGAKAIRAANGLVLTEAESSCVVYGMPRAVVEARLSNESVDLEYMAARLVGRL